ncbi:MAG: hypothetical protein ACRD2C_09565 [Acidimicrobiales bacterium]
MTDRMPPDSAFVGVGDDGRQRWLAVDWLIRANVPLWLEGAHLPHNATALANLSPLRSLEDLVQAQPVVQEAGRAVSLVYENLWCLVANDAGLTLEPTQPHATGVSPARVTGGRDAAQARRLASWVVVADVATEAIQGAGTFLDCATTAAVRSSTAIGGQVREGVRDAAAAIVHAVACIAWRAVRAHS